MASAAPAGENSTPDILSGVGSVESWGFGIGIPAYFFPGLDVSALGGSVAVGLFGDGLPGFEQLEQHISGNPNMVSEMMNIPAIQNLLSDPNIIRNITMNNPQMHEVIDRNPELAHILNDPNIHRYSMEATRNSELMREMMRNTDRAMSNIESFPGGFYMPRQMYENLQEPLLNATSMTGDDGNAPGSNFFASLLGNQTGGQFEDRSTTPLTMSADVNSGFSVPYAIPLPTPWSTNAATRGSQTNNASENRAAGDELGVTGLGIHGLLGLDAQSSSLTDPPTTIQLLQRVAVLQMRNEVINMDSQLRGLVDYNNQGLEALKNLLSQWLSIERLQVQVQQSIASLSSRLGSVSQQSPLGPGQTAGGAAVSPEELYANRLSQLQELGLVDARENIQALLATSSSVYAAVERLLQNRGP